MFAALSLSRAVPYLVVGLLLAGLWGTYTYRGRQLDTARQSLAVCAADRQGLHAAIERQNAAVAAMETSAAEQAQRLNAAQQLAAQAGAQGEARVRETLTATVPAECPRAIGWAAVRGAEMGGRWSAPR